MPTQKPKVKPKKYSVTMQLNGIVLTEKADTVDEALLALKPDTLLTEVYVTATDGKEVAERRLSLQMAKRVFTDDTTRQVFAQNLLLN